MQLQEQEFTIGTLCKGGEMKYALIITIEALERLEKGYAIRAEESNKLGADSMAMYLYGKADLLNDLLKLFEEDRYDG